jgi:UDP-N-acetylmuramoyl-tripeptide--D-alanyl-D-alanine ligase
VAHRLEPTVGSGGGVVLDDTYNANPAGARVALEQLATAAPGGRRVLVTPGMVELGRRQADENARFAAAAVGVVTDLVVVGATNRRALLAGARRGAGTGDGDPIRPPEAGVPAAGKPQVVTLATRDQAVAWVRHHVGPGDAVLYENDLPDHYP